MIKRAKTGLAILIMIVVVNLTVANAVPIVDQEQLTHSSGMTMGSFEYQQEVQVGITGTLTSIDIEVHVAGSVNFYINSGAAWQGDANDGTFNGLVLDTGWNEIDVSSWNLNYTAGDWFVIGLQGLNNGTVLGLAYATNPYVGLLVMGGVDMREDHDLAFVTRMDTASVPEPATLSLLGIGLVGLIGGAARKKFKKKAIAKT